MNTVKPDLSSLVRAGSFGAAARDEITAAGAAVPRPGRRLKTRVALPAAILLAFAAVLAFAARGTLWPAVEVRVVPVVQKDAPAAGAAPAGGEDPIAERGSVLVQAPGWIEPAPFAHNVPALVEGVVDQVLVLEGERVEAGQVIARLIDADESLRVETARATVAERESAVERGHAAVAQAESQVGVERAVAEELRDEVARGQALVGAGGVSEGNLRRSEIRLRGLEARITSAEAAVRQARAEVLQAEAGVRVAQAALDEAMLRLKRTEIRAPVGGVVLARLVEPGSRIGMAAGAGEAGNGAPMAGVVARLYEPTRLQVRVDVPLGDAAKVGIGSVARITTEALPDLTFDGVVTRLVHEANIQRNTVQLKVSVESPSPVLKPEMLTRVRLYAPPGEAARTGAASTVSTSTRTGAAVLLLPAAVLIERSGEAAKVWLVDLSPRGETIASLRALRLGEDQGDGYIRVLEGVRAGDRVVADPPASLREGVRVRVLGEAAGDSHEGDR